MKRIVTMVLICITATTAYAGVRFYNSSDANLGEVANIKCSTGVTCSKTGQNMVMSVSSLGASSFSGSLTLQSSETIANSTDDTVEIASNDEVTTLLVKGFEAKDAILALYADEGDDNADKFSITSNTSNQLIIKNNATALLTMSSGGNIDLVGDLVGDGGDQLVGFLKSQIASSAASLTAAQCGSTIVTAGDHTMVLPEASTVLGCRYSFVGGTADTLTIDPADGTDQIGPINFVAGGTGGSIAPSAGDAVSFTDIGASLVLEACGADLWCPVGVANLTVTDAN